MKFMRTMPIGIAIIVLCLSVSSISLAKTKSAKHRSARPVAASYGSSVRPAAELGLGGIKLGRSAIIILQKYGNPTEIRVGPNVQVERPTSISSSVTPAPSPSSGPSFTMPGLPGMPGSSSLFTPPSASSQPSQVVQSSSSKSLPEVTWVYKFSENRSLEFQVSPDGRVIQIAAFGVRWPGIGTAKGAHLGDTYKDIIAKYGFPEVHEQNGSQLILNYKDRNRVLFSLVEKTLVGITIGLMD